MIRSFALYLFLLVAVSACFLRRNPYKTSQFTYVRNGQAVSQPLVVPKGFIKEEKTDTAGVSLHSFYYPYGAILYTAYLQDTMMELQTFDKRMHQPRVHRVGGQVYKGQDEKELYYREIRQGNLRYGYRLVPGAVELLFDSATNYASLQWNHRTGIR
jgi:hypothetical protein